MSQKDAFLENEGNAYFDRNPKDADCASDPVASSVSRMQLKPERVLEIGCGNGARLDCVAQCTGAECHGIDPSLKAIEFAQSSFPRHKFAQGTADLLPYPDQHFDLVIFGCCLYLCDPQDHFKIAWQVDRVLRPKSFVVVKDFLPPLPFKNEYSHGPGLYSYKMHYSDMFAAHPYYRLLSREYVEHVHPFTYHPNESMSVDILRKDQSMAFLDNSYR